jgi:hypothetical protein
LLDLWILESDVISFFLDGVNDDFKSFLEESYASSPFEYYPSPYPNPVKQGLPTTFSG